MARQTRICLDLVAKAPLTLGDTKEHGFFVSLDLLKKLLCRETDQRIDARSAAQHKWVAQTGYDPFLREDSLCSQQPSGFQVRRLPPGGRDGVIPSSNGAVGVGSLQGDLLRLEQIGHGRAYPQGPRAGLLKVLIQGSLHEGCGYNLHHGLPRQE